LTELRDIEHVGSALPDLLATQREALVVLFPEVFTEGKIDFDKLRVALGDMVNDRPDRYSFSWAGKQDAIRLLQQPSRSTLTPDRGGSVDFDASENMYIAGENLETLKMLYKSYFGRVKMIYIDPPYNTGNDFVYPDSYADPLDMYLRVTGQKDTNGNLLTSNPETSGRYHSAWLSMMYPRLFFARQLLREDGVIFVSIDDHEAPNLRLLMNEIFGEENFVGQIAVQLNPRGRHLDRFLAKTHEYVMVYARDHTQQPLYELEKDERMLREYSKADTVGRYRELELRNRNPAFNRRTRPNLYYPIYVESVTGNAALEGDEIHSVEVYPKTRPARTAAGRGVRTDSRRAAR
jgi:adenine-specific DNA-methyltransferase